MLLERLKDYADRIDRIAPPGYDDMAIKWIIQLDEQGILQGPLIATEGRGGKNDRGKEFMAPHSSEPPHPFDRNSWQITSNISLESPGKAQQLQDSRNVLMPVVMPLSILSIYVLISTDEPSVFAVLKFLESGDVLPALKNIDPSHNLTFRVDDIFPIQLPKVQQFWADYFWEAVLAGEAGTEIDEDNELETESEDLSSRAPRVEMECIVCGNVRPAAPRHPFRLRGFPGRRAGAGADFG